MTKYRGNRHNVPISRYHKVVFNPNFDSFWHQRLDKASDRRPVVNSLRRKPQFYGKKLSATATVGWSVERTWQSWKKYRNIASYHDCCRCRSSCHHCRLSVWFRQVNYVLIVSYLSHDNLKITASVHSFYVSQLCEKYCICCAWVNFYPQ